MINIKKILIFAIFTLASISTKAQIDKQWLIYDGRVKTSFLNNQNVYGLDFQNVLSTGNSFSICIVIANLSLNVYLKN